MRLIVSRFRQSELEWGFQIASLAVTIFLREFASIERKAFKKFPLSPRMQVVVQNGRDRRLMEGVRR